MRFPPPSKALELLTLRAADGDRGTMDCGRAPGQFGHEAHDSAWLAAHKIDWFKSDSCYAKDRSEHGSKGDIDAIILYEKMRDGFNKSGYPIWWALCGWSPMYAGPDKYQGHPVGNALANSARIGPDTGGGWTAVLSNLENALPVQQFTGPSGSGGFCECTSLSCGTRLLFTMGAVVAAGQGMTGACS